MRITFSQIAGLQYVTDGPRKYEAVHTPDGPEIYRAGTNERAQLPERVMRELARRFDEAHKNESYLMEAKPCTI